MFEDRGGGFECFLFGVVELEFDDGFDSAAADDARCAEGYVVQAVLAGHEGGDDEDGPLVAENSLADARDAGGDGEAGVSFEQRDGGTGVTDGDEEFFGRGKGVGTGIVGEREAGDLGGAPDSYGGVSVFADDSGVYGARIDVELLAEDVAETFGVEECAGADDFTGRQAGLFLDDVGEDVYGVCGDDDDAVEAFGHKSRDA